MTQINLYVTPVENNGKRSKIYAKTYSIGKQIIAYIGQPMVRWQEGWDTGKEYIVFEDDFSLNFYYKEPPLGNYRSCSIVGKKGYQSAILFLTEYEDKKYFIVDRECDSGTWVGLLIGEDGKLNESIIADAGHFIGYKLEDVTISPPTTHFELYSGPDMRGGLSRELIFGGVNNVSINVTYREYTPDDMARQAFFQNIIYQTSAEIIRFQDFKIKVHEVTNEKIVFTVIDDGLGAP